MEGIAILILILFLPPILTIIGGFMLIFASDRKKAKRVFLVGAILLGLELLIGFAVCGDMSFH